MEDVSSALKYNKLKYSFSDMEEASTGEDLAVRGRLHQQDNRSKGKLKSKASTVLCYGCHGRWHYKRDCLILRISAGKEHVASLATSCPSDVDNDDFGVGEV